MKTTAHYNYILVKIEYSSRSSTLWMEYLKTTGTENRFKQLAYDNVRIVNLNIAYYPTYSQDQHSIIFKGQGHAFIYIYMYGHLKPQILQQTSNWCSGYIVGF